MRTIVAALMLFALPAAFAQEALHVEAVKLEMAGKGPQAVRAYVRAARAGSAKAATRLAEIYEHGSLGVARNYAESVKWRNAARVLGEKMDGGWGCPPKC